MLNILCFLFIFLAFISWLACADDLLSAKKIGKQADA
jgi:hypothetical protein